MEADGKTRLFIDGGNVPNTWVREVYPQNDGTVRLEGDRDRDVRLRLDAICADEASRWSVTQILAAAYTGTTFEIDKSANGTGQLPELAEAVERRLGATGLTLLITHPEAVAS